MQRSLQKKNKSIIQVLQPSTIDDVKNMNSISFNFIKPEMKFETPHNFPILAYYLEKFNTNFHDCRKNLSSLKEVPRMSTLAIGTIINNLVSHMDSEDCYLNVGVWNGYTLFSGMIHNNSKYCIGVDNFSEFGGPKNSFMNYFNSIKSPFHMFHDENYSDYLEDTHGRRKIGCYFYDGNHDYKHQLLGLELAEPLFSKNAVILVDDINLKDAENATLDFISNSKNQYEIIFQQKTANNMHPTYWNGLMIIRRIA